MSWWGSDAPVPGDAATMVDTGKHLTTLSGAFERAGDGFKAINTGGWYGDAADGFHSYLDIAAPKWFRSADAFESAGRAVAEYAATLENAQRRAKQAKAELEAAQERSNAAREQHNAAVEQASSGNGRPPPPFSDPAADDIAAARDAITRAKGDVQAAGDRAAQVVLAAAKEAPAEPGTMTKLKENFTDTLQMQGNLLGNIGSGVVTGLDSMLQGVRTMTPFDPYNLTHPAGYAENMSGMAQGVAHSITHPAAAFKTAVNWDMWANNPGKALGTLVPSVVGTVFGVGAAGKAAGVASKLSKVSTTAGKIAEKVPGTGKVDAPTGRPPGPTAPGGQHPGSGHPPGGQPGGGHPGSSGHAPPAAQPGPGTPWGNSDMPPAPNQGGMPSHAPDPGIQDYSRPDGSFGPQGSQPDVADEPPQNYSDSGPRRMPWEDADGVPDDWPRDPVAEQDQPWVPANSHETPSLNGEHELGQPSSDRVPAGPDARPEMHDVPGSDGSTGHQPGDDLKTPEQELKDQADLARNDPQTGQPWSNWESLSDREVVELSEYRGGGYSDMNEALRTGDQDMLEKLEPQMQEIDSALEKMPVHEGTVHRGIGIPESQIDEFLARHETGETVQYDAYTSSSQRPEGAMNRNVELIMDSDSGRDIAKGSQDAEAEVLFPRGTNFEITDRHYNPATDTWQIYMKDLGQGGK